MSQLFKRKPITELVIDEHDPRALKRVLGAGDLVMLAIGAVIGAGIFGAIGTAAAGQVAPDGTPELVVSGAALVGIAFGPHGELVVTSNETAYRFE